MSSSRDSLLLQLGRSACTFESNLSIYPLKEKTLPKISPFSVVFPLVLISGTSPSTIEKKRFRSILFPLRFLFCTDFHFPPLAPFSCQSQSLSCDSLYCKPTELLARGSRCCEGFDKRHICIWIHLGQRAIIAEPVPTYWHCFCSLSD